MKESKLLLNLVLLITLAITSSSCDKGSVFEKYLKLKNSTWDRFDIKQFDIPIVETANTYDITLVVRCTEQFELENIPFYVILTSPSGEESIREIAVPVRERGKLISEPETSKPETRLILWKNINIAEGKCKISIENLIPKIQTGGIDEVGILVTIAK